MATDESTGRSFTEGETYALVEQAVQRETASLSVAKTELEREKASLEERIDVLETEKAAAVKRADEAEQAFADYKDEAARQVAAAQLLTDRAALVHEINPDLELTESRSKRLVAYSEEDFEGYLDDLRQVAAKKKAPADDGDADDADAKKKSKGDMPRESAAFKGAGPDSKDAPTTPVLSLVAAARGLRA